MKVGDKFKRTYPYHLVGIPNFNPYDRSDGIDDFWVGGCRKIQDSEYSHVLVANGVGFIEFEVLAITKMPRKYQDRVLYRVTMTDPEGAERKKHKVHTVTLKKFKSFIKHSDAYHYEYEIEE